MKHSNSLQPDTKSGVDGKSGVDVAFPNFQVSSNFTGNMDYSDTLQPNLIINSQVPGVVHLAVIDSSKYQANNGQIDSTSMGRIGILPCLLILLLTIVSISLFAETFAAQGFEQGSADTWNYTPNTVSSGYWGFMDGMFGVDAPQSGTQYWASCDLANSEGTLTFDNLNLPLGYIYTLSFYYYTSLLSSPEEYSRYSVSYDNGSTWSQWTDLSPNSEAWSLVSVEIPDYQRQFKLKVAAKHSGTSKYAHWDSFYLSREVAPPQPPSVFNMQIAQRTDGSGLVDIYYDLFDANNDLSTIALLVSDNAGTSYEVIPSPENLSGDIGADILSAANKHIVWNAGAESINYEGDQYKFRLLAEDNTYPPLALPTFTPEAGEFIGEQSVSISCAILGATIRYTTNGTEPTESSDIYSTPLIISSTTTLKAKAFKAHWTASETASGVYTILPSDFVYLPAGTFTMGNTQGDAYPSEIPHTVTLNSFYMGKYEVTQGEYQAIMGSNPASDYGVGTNYPVYNVPWYSTLIYCNLRSMAEGLTPVYSIDSTTNPSSWGAVPIYGNSTWNHAICNWSANGYRLLTEAEWEYAARGGTNTPDYLYSGSDDLDAVAWNINNSSGTSHIVGTKAANGLGIFDMSGNVIEWCWDGWYLSYYSISPVDNPTGALTTDMRVMRGGYFNYGGDYNYRVSHRSSQVPYNGSIRPSGFRVCRVLN